MLASRETYSVSSLAALREVSSLKSSMTKSQAEAVLASLVAKGWLLKSKLSDFSRFGFSLSTLKTFLRRARYSLSTRALLELLPYLKSNYPDECLECTICLEVMFFFRFGSIVFPSIAHRSSRAVAAALRPIVKQKSITIALESSVRIAHSVLPVWWTGHKM